GAYADIGRQLIMDARTDGNQDKETAILTTAQGASHLTILDTLSSVAGPMAFTFNDGFGEEGTRVLHPALPGGSVVVNRAVLAVLYRLHYISDPFTHRPFHITPL